MTVQAAAPANQNPGLLRLLFLGRDGSGLGRRLSMYLSTISTVIIWYFFFHLRGWKPPIGMEADYSTYIHWLLLSYVAAQLTLLICTSAGGSRSESWLDAVTTMVPFALVVYALLLHWNHFEELP